MSAASRAVVIVFGGWRSPLVVVSAIGYVLQYFAFRSYYDLVGGDGWRELGPGLAILVFSPVQVSAAISVVLAYGRAAPAGTATASAPLPPGVGAYGLDEAPLEFERASRTARVAVWTLVVPAAVMALLTALGWFGAAPPGVNVIAGPMSVVWVPAWASGVVAAVSAMNRLHDSGLMWWAALYPALVVVYANT
jgi:hypothetical protein